MEKIIFTVRDSKVERYLQPFFETTKASAMRAFGDVCNSDDHQFKIHSGDYTLFAIGTFDDESGEIRPYKTHENLGLAAHFIKHEPSHPDQLPLMSIGKAALSD